MNGLFQKITEWCIKYGVIKTSENCFNLPNNGLMLCFDKLTGEHNNKKHFYFFSFCWGISLSKQSYDEVEIIKLNRVNMEYQYY